MAPEKSEGIRQELMHLHFILDAELEKLLDFERRHEITKNLINELIQTLNMKELSPLKIYDASDHDYPGWSFIQPITTSHVSGHYFEEQFQPSHIHLDIYSCKNFNWETALAVIDKHLKLSSWLGNLVARDFIDVHKRTIITISS